MSDADLDVLLQMDSPTATINNGEPVGMLQTEAADDCSLLSFGCEISPSHIFSEFSESSRTQSAAESSAKANSSKVNCPRMEESFPNNNQHLAQQTKTLEEQLQKLQTLAARHTPSKEKSEGCMPLPVATIKQEVLEFSSVEAAQERCFDTTFANEFKRFEDEDAAFLNLDLDFEPFGSLEHASGRSTDTSTLQQEGRVCQSEVGAAVRPQLAPQNISASCPMLARLPRAAFSAHDCSTSSDNQQNDAIHFLALDYASSPTSSTTSNQRSRPISMELFGSTAQNVSLEQPLDFSRCTNTNENNSAHAIPSSCKSSTTNSASHVEFHLINNSVADATMVPPSVKQLYDVIRAKYSDFAFVYALSAQLCQDRVPMDCFVSLKLGLLLSLASIGVDPDRPPIPIVAIGSDTYMANYLMNSVGQLGSRYIGPTDDIKPPSGAGFSNHNWIEADPILLAKGGVFYVGDWSRLKLARADKLFKIIECSRVPVEKTTITYSLETTIWTHWRSFKYNAKDQQTFNKFVKIFGIPIYVDDVNHEVLVNFTLEQSSARLFESTVDHLSISSYDMRSFLSAISKRTVDLTPEASALLQKYFVAARIARPDCLSQQAFVVLKQFSESFAKLSFRHEVVLIDAIAAIYLCEHFMQSIFGSGDNPPPPFESHNFVGAVDKQIAQFHQWLQTYIATYYDKP